MPCTWSWLEICLDGDAKLMVQLLLVRVVRTVGHPFGDLSSVASTLAFSAAPAGASIYWVLLYTVPFWDLPFDKLNDDKQVKKGFMRLAMGHIDSLMCFSSSPTRNIYEQNVIIFVSSIIFLTIHMMQTERKYKFRMQSATSDLNCLLNDKC